MSLRTYSYAFAELAASKGKKRMRHQSALIQSPDIKPGEDEIGAYHPGDDVFFCLRGTETLIRISTEHSEAIPGFS